MFGTISLKRLRKKKSFFFHIALARKGILSLKMSAFWHFFLQHFSTIWSQYFVSPYVLPTVFALCFRKWHSIEGAYIIFTLSNIFFFGCEFLYLSVVTSLFLAFGDLIIPPFGFGAGFPIFLALHALVLHFPDAHPTNMPASFLPPFYGDCFWIFNFLFVAYSSPRFSWKWYPFQISLGIGISILCTGLAFGIQHWVYLAYPGWEMTDVPTIAVSCMVAAFSIWLLLLLTARRLPDWLQSLQILTGNPGIEPIVRIVITVLILGFALSGFLFLHPYQATLWLLFWIVAYPVALSFTRGEPLKEASLVQIYVAGLKQVPVVGQVFGAYAGKSSTSSPDTSSGEDPRKPGPASPKTGP